MTIVSKALSDFCDVNSQRCRSLSDWSRPGEPKDSPLGSSPFPHLLTFSLLHFLFPWRIVLKLMTRWSLQFLHIQWSKDFYIPVILDAMDEKNDDFTV